MSTVQRNVTQLRDLGITVEQVWSPADTDADTRYLIDDGTGRRVLFHREVPGFLAGARTAQPSE